MYNEVRIFVENKPGKLSHVVELLGNAGVNILAMELADEGQFGVVKILTAEPERAKDVLSEQNVPAALGQVAVIEIDDKLNPSYCAPGLAYANRRAQPAHGCVRPASRIEVEA